MVVNLKIYKFSDPDMYALHNAGISVPALMKLAIAYRARSRRLRIFIPDCLYCDLSGQKRHIPLKITIKDKASIDYLRTALKEGSRTANIKIILRNCMVEQITGPTLRDRQLVLAENARLMLEAEDYKKQSDILVLPPGTSRRSYYPMILNRTVEIPFEKEKKKKTSTTKGPVHEKLQNVPGSEKKEIPYINIPEPMDDAEAEEYVNLPDDISTSVPMEVKGYIDLPDVMSAADERKDDAGNAESQDNIDLTALQDDGTEEMSDEEADEDFFSQFESLG